MARIPTGRSEASTPTMMESSEAPWSMTRTFTPACASAPNSLAATPVRRDIPWPTVAIRARLRSTPMASGSQLRRISASTESSTGEKLSWSITTHMESMPDGESS